MEFGAQVPKVEQSGAAARQFSQKRKGRLILPFIRAEGLPGQLLLPSSREHAYVES